MPVQNRLYLDCLEGSFSGMDSRSDRQGFQGSGYLSGDIGKGSVGLCADLSPGGYYEFRLRYAAAAPFRLTVLAGGWHQGSPPLGPSVDFVEKRLGVLRLGPGRVEIVLRGGWGIVDLDGLVLERVKGPGWFRRSADFRLTDPDASAEARRLMSFFRSIHGKKIITGQHVNSQAMPEIARIREVTGRLPFLLGLDFLGLSRRTDTADISDHARSEIDGTKDCVEQALDWSGRGGIVTFTWHWFAPTGGRDKSFYTKNTSFDLTQALLPGTPEHEAMLGDMDFIAEGLARLRDAKVPVLWRPLHEADGGWFWWGAKGPEAYKKLYRLMYGRFVRSTDCTI